MNLLRILGLVPIRNGENYLPEFFLYNNKVITDYLFLNDNSTDTTLEIIQREPKVIKIIQAKPRDDFRDDLNRNELLQESYKLKDRYDWGVWLDADEILYGVELKAIPSTCTVLKFPYVHLWNSSETYNKDYPYSNEGIQFREKGFSLNKLQKCYRFNKKLHFNQIPIDYDQEKVFTVKGYILHKGNINYKHRVERFNRYKVEDPFNEYQPIGYDHFLNNTPRVGKVVDLLQNI
jgi:hypothetical protein